MARRVERNFKDNRIHWPRAGKEKTVENINGQYSVNGTRDNAFSKETVELLKEALDPKLVDSYTGAGGKEYSYLETNEVINQHNRIFGHGNWYYRVKAGPTLCRVEHVDAQTGAIRTGEYYAALVALYVFDHEMFSDEGFGLVDQMKPGTSMHVVLENHEKARKGSISDGLKRCSRGLGNQFGNALYAGDGEGSSSDPNQPTCPRHGPGRHIRESNRGDGYYCSRKDNTETGYCAQTPYVPAEVPLTRETASYAAPAPSGPQRNGGAVAASHGSAAQEAAGDWPYAAPDASASATNGVGSGAPSRDEVLEEYIAIGIECGLNRGQIFTNYMRKHGKPISQATTDELALLVQQAREIEREQG